MCIGCFIGVEFDELYGEYVYIVVYGIIFLLESEHFLWKSVYLVFIFVCSFVRLFCFGVCTFVRLLVCVFVRLFVCWFWLFVCTFVRLFVCLRACTFVVEFWWLGS